MGKIRVVICDDSSLARGLLRHFLETEPDIEVIGEAHHGREALHLACTLQPDLMTMDLEMPVMNGLDAITEIMATRALPILVVSSIADAQNACEAVRRGALEVVSKPDYGQDAAAEFVAKVRLLAGVRVITHLRVRHGLSQATSPSIPPPLLQAMPVVPEPHWPGLHQRVIAVASSTGGPQALAQILPQLPSDFPSPILVAQHISDGFAPGMVDWLGGLCRLPVKLAVEGEMIHPGTIYISPSERHLAVNAARRINLLERTEKDIYRPSCDALLHSVAEVYGRHAVGIILTGMGRDGAKGMARIFEKGGMTMGQDEASSVIYGMNRVAIEAGVVHRVVGLDRLPAEIMQVIRTLAVH